MLRRGDDRLNATGGSDDDDEATVDELVNDEMMPVVTTEDASSWRDTHWGLSASIQFLDSKRHSW